MGNMKIKGKVILITGSGRGLGRVFAEKLASEGAKIVINEISAI
jgi:3-oxoacyl-[acyl-carrier protein] reductase